MEPINNIISDHAFSSSAQIPTTPAPTPPPAPIAPPPESEPEPIPTPPATPKDDYTRADEEFPDPFASETKPAPASSEQESPEDKTTQPNTIGEPPELTPAHIDQIKMSIGMMQQQLSNMLEMLGGAPVPSTPAAVPSAAPAAKRAQPVINDANDEPEGEVIEGVFDGLQMVDAEGKSYNVSPNYASKSKLVEGDFLKLTITPSGKFLYKQIGPIERKRLVGELIQDADSDQWSVVAEGRNYHILKASVTFYKGAAGDEVVILVPQDGESSWGAVENIINKS